MSLPLQIVPAENPRNKSECQMGNSEEMQQIPMWDKEMRCVLGRKAGDTKREGKTLPEQKI